MMRAKAQKWGNSLAVRIPKVVAEEVGLHEQDELDIDVDSNAIRLTPRRHVLTLKQLLGKVTEANLHVEADYGRPQGREAW